MSNDELKSLVNDYLSGVLDSADLSKLSALLDDPRYEEKLKDLMYAHLELISTQKYEYPDTHARIKQKVMERMFQKQPAKIRFSNFKTGWLRYAAVFLILIGTGWYLLMPDKKELLVNPPKRQVSVKDIAAPSSAHAMITLSNGRQVVLDSLNNGTLAVDGGISVVKLADGQIAYTGNTGEIQYNTLTNPRGSRIVNLMLADGTRVWLNAESSLHYPTAFPGKERKVTVSGEAYFEVVKNKEKPFIVLTNKEEIKVLGTSFNVNSYLEATVNKISLVEGSLLVNNSRVTPGQAYFGGKISETNLDQDLAWKHGVFNFNDLNVETAMQQLSRWYNIDIHYVGQVPDGQFGGKIGRNLSLLQVLNVLDGVGVRLVLEGRLLSVKSL